MITGLALSLYQAPNRHSFRTYDNGVSVVLYDTGDLKSALKMGFIWLPYGSFRILVRVTASKSAYIYVYCRPADKEASESITGCVKAKTRKNCYLMMLLSILSLRIIGVLRKWWL